MQCVCVCLCVCMCAHATLSRTCVAVLLRQAPAVQANGAVIVACWSGVVSALDPSTGSPLWSFPTGSNVDSSPSLAADGSVLFGSWAGVVYSLAGSTGVVQVRLGRGPRPRGCFEQAGGGHRWGTARQMGAHPGCPSDVAGSVCWRVLVGGVGGGPFSTSSLHSLLNPPPSSLCLTHTRTSLSSLLDILDFLDLLSLPSLPDLSRSLLSLSPPTLLLCVN
jgi:hypothetical protein